MAKWLYRLSILQCDIDPLIERFKEINYKPLIGESYSALLANESGSVEITLTITTPRGRAHKYIAEEMFPTYNASKIGDPVLLVETTGEKLWQYLADMWKESVGIYLGTLAAVGATIDTISNHVSVEIVKGQAVWHLTLGYFDIILLFLYGAIPSLVYLLTSHKGINKIHYEKSNQNNNQNSSPKKSPI